MLIKFNHITIKNFMSVGEVDLDLNDLGLVQVIGENLCESKSKSNGSGKSAITSESILWCLTGDTSKNAVNVNNLFTGKDAEVTINFNIDNDVYIVTRINSKTKKLLINKNGNDISGATYTKSKEILDKELNFINYKVLTSLIILSQGLKGRFSELKASERKSNLEYLTGIDELLEKMQTELSNNENLIKTNIQNINMDLSKNNGIIQTSNLTISNCNAKLEEAKSLITQDEYNSLKSFCDKCNQDIEQLNSQINSISQENTDILAKREELNTQILGISNKIHECENSLNLVDRNKKDYESQKQSLLSQIQIASDNVCPMCHQTLQNQELLNQLKSSLDSVEFNIANLNYENTCNELNSQITTYKSQLDTLSSNIGSFNDSINLNNTKTQEIKTQINNILADISVKDKLIKSFEDSKALNENLVEIIKNSQESIDKCNEEIGKLNVVLNKYNKDLEINKYFKGIVSRKFRNFLLKGTLDYINQRLAYYSPKLFSDYTIYLENDGNNIDIRLNNKYFEDLSGGESRKVDIAIQLSIRDLTKNQRNFNCNLLTLDEILDYLDTSGIDCVLNLIQEESKSVSTMFVISHKEDLDLGADTKLLVTKANEITTARLCGS